MNENRTFRRGLLRRQVLETAVALGGSRLVPAAPIIAAAASAAAQSAQPSPGGANNLVGWMVTYNGPASGPYLGARLYSSAGFAPRSQLDAFAAQQPLRHLRFSPNGGWVIIGQNNTLAFSQDVGGPAFPQDAHDSLQNVVAAGNTVLDIFFSPTNDFVIKALLGDGTRQYLKSQYFNVEILNFIQEFDPPSGTSEPASGRSELLCLVFPPPPPLPGPTPQGLQSTVWTSCIVLCDNNNFSTLNINPPTDVVNQLAAIKASANGLTYPVADKATNIVYSSATGWMVTTAKDLRYASGSFDPALGALINQLDQDQHEAGYVLSLSDIVIEVPVRNVSFQVQTIDVVTPRSGAFDNSDTLVGQIWIGVDEQPLQIQGMSFGNEVKAGTVLGLGGVQTSNRPQGGLGPIGLPAALPPQYAMSVGPAQISNPRSSLTFGFMLVNNGSQNFPLGGSVQNLAKAALGLVGTAVNALGAAIGIPGIGSITTGLISGLGSNAFPSSGCDGLCATETFNLSGGAVMALDYQAQNGLTLQQTLPYNNMVFPDSAFLSGQSPYDPNSNSPLGCQTSNYKVTSAIFESDSELMLPNAYGPPASSGKTQVLAPSRIWPPAQTINGTDTTPEPLAACVFPPLNLMYLFWTANDTSNKIFYSSSADGVTWPGGQLVEQTGGQPPIGQTAAALAACAYQNNLSMNIFLFWVANNGSNKIYYAFTRDGQNWGTNGTINSTDTTPQTPTACVFQNRLFLFWTANDSSHFLWFSSYAGDINQGGFPSGPGGIGDPWPPGQRVNFPCQTTTSPAACVFNNQLFLFWSNNVSATSIGLTDVPQNSILFVTSADGQNFSNQQILTSVDSTPIALAACVFQRQLFVFWKANDPSNSIYFSSSWDGQTWSNGVKINNVDTTPTPLAACVFQNRISLFWKANDPSNRIFTSASQRPIWIGTTP